MLTALGLLTARRPQEAQRYAALTADVNQHTQALFDNGVGRSGGRTTCNPRRVSLTPGSRLGPCEMTALLGEGGTGQVAIKVLDARQHQGATRRHGEGAGLRSRESMDQESGTRGRG